MWHNWVIDSAPKEQTNIFLTTLNASNADTQTQNSKSKKSEKNDDEQEEMMQTNDEETLQHTTDNSDKRDTDQDQKDQPNVDEDDHLKKNTDDESTSKEQDEDHNANNGESTHEPILETEADCEIKSKVPNKNNVKDKNKKKGNKSNNKILNPSRKKVKSKVKKRGDDKEQTTEQFISHVSSGLFARFIRDSKINLVEGIVVIEPMMPDQDLDMPLWHCLDGTESEEFGKLCINDRDHLIDDFKISIFKIDENFKYDEDERRNTALALLLKSFNPSAEDQITECFNNGVNILIHGEKPTYKHMPLAQSISICALLESTLTTLALFPAPNI